MNYKLLLTTMRLLALTVGTRTATSALGQPQILAHPESLTVLAGGETATFSVKASGVTPLSFQWHRNNLPLAGKTTARLELPRVTGEQTGDYSVVVTDAGGSITSKAAQLSLERPKLLIPLDQRWRFNDSGAGFDKTWSAPEFDDSKWLEGQAPFFNEPANLPISKTTLLAITNAAGNRVNTYYFRTRFHHPFAPNTIGRPTLNWLILTNFVDDGAVFYLNGVELSRLRMPSGPVDSSTPATVAPEGRATVLMANIDRNPLKDRDNLLAVEVHQHDGTGVPDVLFGMSLAGSSLPPQMPDLMPWMRNLLPRLEEWTFKPEDCEVREGLVLAGKRRLLRFTTETRNAGTADLVMGSPAGNPEFVFHACHNHHHFQGFVSYRLVHPQEGTVVVDGGKPSFAIEDGERWDPEASPTGRFTAENSGIQRGWSDIYGQILPGQWLDVTGVPPGRYWLEISMDPDKKIPELVEDNNSAQVEVHIPETFPGCDGPPPNDNFADAQVIPSRAASILVSTRCATRESREPRLPADNPDRPGGPSVWFRWVAPLTGPITISTEGSNFDTLLALYRGQTLTQLTRVAFDDGSGVSDASRLIAEVTAGTEYYISVEGFYSFMARRAGEGDLVLTFLSDAFAKPAIIEGSSGSIMANTLGATWEEGESAHRELFDSTPSNASVWFQWTPRETGSFTFVIDTTPDQRSGLESVQIYEGDALGALTPKGMDGRNWSARATVQSEAGRSYRVVVATETPGGVVAVRWDRSGLYLEPAAIRQDGVDFDLHPDLSARIEEFAVWQIQASDDLIRWVPWKTLRNSSPNGFPKIQRFTVPLAETPCRYFRARGQ